MSPLVDALSGNWYWGMSLCECNCTQVPLQVIIFHCGELFHKSNTGDGAGVLKTHS